MNIIVKPYGSTLCSCRPDTTWERENKDFYSPECVNEVMWTPVVFARVSKAGKCIGNKFVGRYYDGVGCGILMYCATDEAVTSCADHTSILPMPLYNPEVLDGRKEFVVTKNGNLSAARSIAAVLQAGKTGLVSSTGQNDLVMSAGQNDLVMSAEQGEWRHLLEDAICNASRLTSLRIGDFVAAELTPPQSLATREESEVSVKGTFCDNDIFDFKIIF